MNELSDRAHRALARLAGAQGVSWIDPELGSELCRSGLASRMGEGYLITGAGMEYFAVSQRRGEAPALPPEQGRPEPEPEPEAPERTEPLF